ncbi:MAG TPA: energy transducer TonB, partial [Bacteroidia bacterium]|nr:energy transducer TonB [Bacteroidia bacterium]
GGPNPPTPVHTSSQDTDQIYTLVEKMPEYPGGTEAMKRFMVQNTHYPEPELESGVQGKVFISFVVDKTGKITDAKVLKGVKGGPGLDKEALRVVNLMPAWTPGKINGRVVRVQYNLPVVFTLNAAQPGKAGGK